MKKMQNHLNTHQNRSQVGANPKLRNQLQETLLTRPATVGLMAGISAAC
jgi:hypothetical protein